MNIRQKIKNLSKPGKNLSQKVVRSTFWAGFGKISERILRFIRTMIVARLLAPSDFGLFGLACLAMDILQTFTQTGMSVALIQKKENTEEYLNTAWTVSLIRSIILFFALFFFSPLVAIFFNNPAASGVTKAVSFTVLFGGLSNIGTIYFSKEIDFRKDFVINLSKIISGTVVTIILAFILRNSWALVWGMLSGSLVRCIVSYIIHPYRPKFHFEWHKAKELLNFGKWIFGSGIVLFLVTQGDDILVGKLLGTTALGFYALAYAVANLVATEISRLISQVTFPAYAKLQDEKEKLKKAYFKTFQVTSFIVIPIAACVFLLSYEFTNIFLGEKWLPMVPALKILTFCGLMRALFVTGGSLFVSVGRPNMDFKILSIRLIIMAIFIYPAIKFYGILGASFTVLLGFLFAMPTWFYATKKITDADFSIYAKSVLPSLIGTSVLIAFIYFMKHVIYFNIFNFMLLIPVLIAIYLGVILGFESIAKYSPIKEIKLLARSV